MKEKDLRYISYPYLSEEDNCCDHELLTDRLSSELGLIASKLNLHPKEKEVILEVCEKVYHVNGSIRGTLAIEESDLQNLSELYNFYEIEVSNLTKAFLLPTGNEIGALLHLARCSGKQVVRNMHKVKKQGRHVEKILFDYMNLVSNFLFILALYINKKEKYEEKIFISKSY